MRIDRISTGLDWMHARLPKASRATFRIAAVLLAIGAIHVFAASLIDAYTLRVLELPLGHLLGVFGVFAFLAWVPMVLMRIFLGLRARLCRRGGSYER